jgi:ATP-binding cassette subfamily C protein
MSDDNNMTQMQLRGGDMHIANDPTCAYEVNQGIVLVYLFPFQDGKPGKRMLLAEVGEGTYIPGFVYDTPDSGAWRIGLVALERATITPWSGMATATTKQQFAKLAQIPLLDTLEDSEDPLYEEALIEKYYLNQIKEEGSIYYTTREQEETNEKNLWLIHDLFHKARGRRITPESGNRIYDGAAFLCDQLGIPVVSYDTLTDSCGNHFSVSDIARVSHFVTREVLLVPNWYTSDSEPLLAYSEKDGQPFPCIPKGSGGYRAYDVKNHSYRTIDEKFAKTLKPRAEVFYRPFPNKSLKLKDVILFGCKSLQVSDIARLFFLSLFGTLIGLLLPYMNEQLYDRFIPSGSTSILTSVCLVLLACNIGNFAFTIVKNLASFRSIRGMKYTVQNAVYDRLFQLPESTLREYDSVELAQRAEGFTMIYNTFGDMAVKAALSAVFSLLYLWQMFRYSKKLSVTTLILLLICMAFVVWIGIIQTKYEQEKMELDAKAGSILYQFINGIAKIRIAGVENRVMHEYLKPYTQSRAITIRKEKMTIAVNTLIGAMPTLFSMVLYYIMVKNKMDLTIGSFIAFTTAFGTFSGAMLQVVSSFMIVNDVKPAYDRIKPILEALPEYEEGAVMPGNIRGDIEVNNLRFSYDKDTEMVLKDLSFRIKAGEYVGIVGSSGSGKSTLLKLLLGFEKPTMGKIYYDGQDIDSLDKRELRKRFGVVLQDGQLISGSIHENITITAPQAKMDRVKAVIKEVGLEEDIASMPMGIHTVLSEEGGTISGGQKQRILIARAIIGKPKVIFFDEATSALDNTTQAKVCESLERLRATRLVIAHRLSTVEHCDRILVLENGKLIEEGNFKELMEKKGRFYQLAIRQMS